MEEKKEQLLEHLRGMSLNPNIKRIANVAKAIRQLFLLIAAFVAMIMGYYQAAVKFGDENFFIVIKVTFIVVMIADGAFLIKEIIQVIYGLKISKINMGSYYNQDYETLVSTEKTIRKISLVCDLISELVRSIFITILGGAFIVFGIYFFVTNKGEDTMANIIALTIYPLMGIIAMSFVYAPLIAIIKELFKIDKRDWEEYHQIQTGKKHKKQKKIEIVDMKLFMVGLLFFLCGLFSLIGGLGYIAAGDMAQVFGLSFMGLLFMGIGGAVAYFFGMKINK